MKSFAEIDIETNGDYIHLLKAIASLSGLYSDNEIPLINYRAAENIFCRCFDALNLSRSDTAFDAKYGNTGIGLKTFVCPNNVSNEKIAEFNSLANELKQFKGLELAKQIANYRNKRIELAKRLYQIDRSIYHIVARKTNELFLFETDYDIIDTDNIKLTDKKESSLHFTDGTNRYSYNFSKSTLYRKFHIPQDAYRIPIEILEDPYELLKNISSISFEGNKNSALSKGKDYIILPLYGRKKKEKHVFEKSGLNQWNAGGRKRDPGELYIPIPKEIHKQHSDFFPPRDKEFTLHVPSGDSFSVKVCQDGSKALMSNPNKALSNWLLRTVLQLQEGELATMSRMNELGFDSVYIYKLNENEYRIDKASSGSYEDFI